MANEPTVPIDPPVVVVETPETPKTPRIACEFCGCVLDSEGKVLRRGEAAKHMLDLEDQVQASRDDHIATKEELVKVRAELATLRDPKSQRRGILGIKPKGEAQ